MEQWPRILALGFLSATLAGSANAEMIHLMARKGDTEKVMELIDDGVPVDLPASSNAQRKGMSPLFIAAQFGRAEVVQALIAAGADINSGGLVPEGEEPWGAPIHIAASWGQEDVVQMLIEANVDLNAFDRFLGTPLHVARQKGQAAIEEMLIAAGARTRVDQDSISHLIRDADLENGRVLVRGCNFCHGLDAEANSEQNSAPNLWGVVGRPLGSAPGQGFEYSTYITERGGTWDYDTLSSFLASPYEFLPGTTMTFRGIEDPMSRANLIAYLRTLSDDPVPLP